MISLPFDDGAIGGARMGRGMMMGGSFRSRENLPLGAAFDIFKIKVVKALKINRPLPQTLTAFDPGAPARADNETRSKQFFLSMGHMQWTINGRVFQMEEVADEEIVRLGTKEIWEFDNTGGGMGMMNMMEMPHPIHLHGRQFRVIERSGVRHEGYVDEGWKDTVLIMPGERVRILVGFENYPGMFLYHCHNLEHEDMGMMRNYFIVG
jgi:FtsP/CotA-like multicopper oxidase with cupredoxin domain